MNKSKTIYAEDLNFWKSGKQSPDKWIDLAKRQIEGLGGSVLAEAFGSDGGRSAYILGFEIGGEKFKMVWPVVKSKSGDVSAERRQAATTLYHVVKAKCLDMVVRGARVAFAGELLLPNGRTVGEMTNYELVEAMPLMLMSPSEI